MHNQNDKLLYSIITVAYSIFDQSSALIPKEMKVYYATIYTAADYLSLKKFNNANGVLNKTQGLRVRFAMLDEEFY